MKRPIRAKMEAYAIPRGDGRTQIQIVNAPPMHPFPHTERWSPFTAAKMTEMYTRFLDSEYGIMAADEMCDRLEKAAGESIWDDSDFDPGLDLQIGMSRAWSGRDFSVIFAEDPFVDMLTAAALSAPEELLTSEELISPSGVIYFEREQDFAEKFAVKAPIRAVGWDTQHFLEKSIIRVLLYCEGQHVAESWENYSPKYAAPKEMAYYLHPIGFVFSPLAEIGQTDPTGDPRYTPLVSKINGFIRSVTAIVGSAHSKDKTVSVESAKAKKHRVRKGLPAPRNVRVLSLHNPEYGRYELDGATGRKLRRHWVRGHWRNQWYRGEQVNKRIWIDGFIRGDADLGTVTGQKVYVARAPKLEDVSV